MATFENYAIKTKDAVFYTTSKEPREGFTTNTYVDKSTGVTKTNYHKTVNILKGKFVKAVLKDTNFGERFSIYLTNDDTPDHLIILDVPVFSGKAISGYIKSLCQMVGALSPGKETTFSLNKKQDKNGYFYKNFLITQNGENVPWDFPLYGDDSPVPKGVETIDKVTKKPKWDFSDADAFFYDIISKYRKEDVVAQAQTMAAKEEVDDIKKTHNPFIENVPEKIDDGLPF